VETHKLHILLVEDCLLIIEEDILTISCCAGFGAGWGRVGRVVKLVIVGFLLKHGGQAIGLEHLPEVLLGFELLQKLLTPLLSLVFAFKLIHPVLGLTIGEIKGFFDEGELLLNFLLDGECGRASS
jgi:hypothetical protein